MQYTSSVEALQVLLHYGPPLLYNAEERHTKNNNNNDTTACHITKPPQRISYMRNGIEYCFVEVTCDNGTQYGLQAYGKEATELYKEAYRCAMCGKTPTVPTKSNIIEEIIDGTWYSFDSNICALIFKKLSSVVGKILC